MGFKSLLETSVQNAMLTLGQTDGLAPTQTYIALGDGTYDPATATRTQSETSYTGVPMVLARFAAKEVDNEAVLVTDQKAIIAALDLPVTPKTQDRISTAGGDLYEVIDFMGVPGDSVYILQIRKIE